MVVTSCDFGKISSTSSKAQLLTESGLLKWNPKRKNSERGPLRKNKSNPLGHEIQKKLSSHNSTCGGHAVSAQSIPYHNHRIYTGCCHLNISKYQSLSVYFNPTFKCQIVRSLSQAQHHYLQGAAFCEDALGLSGSKWPVDDSMVQLLPRNCRQIKITQKSYDY